MQNKLFFHHIGYTVADISASVKAFAALGYQAGEVLYDEALQVELCYLEREGAPCIELVHQHDIWSLERKLLSAEGVMPYHVCYASSCFDAACEEMRRLKHEPLFEPVPVKALGNKRICYFRHPELGLTEILEL